MGLYHTEDQAMLKDSVAPFLAENGSIKQLRSLRDSNDATGFARDLWSQFAEMGLNGILIPEAQGGAGGDHRDVAPGGAQPTEHLRSLVRSDPAADAEHQFVEFGEQATEAGNTCGEVERERPAGLRETQQTA